MDTIYVCNFCKKTVEEHNLDDVVFNEVYYGKACPECFGSVFKIVENSVKQIDKDIRQLRFKKKII